MIDRVEGKGYYPDQEEKRCNEDLKLLKRVSGRTLPKGASNQARNLSWLTAFDKKMKVINPSVTSAWRKLKSLVDDDRNMGALEAHIVDANEKIKLNPELYLSWSEVKALLFAEMMSNQVDQTVDAMMDDLEYNDIDYYSQMESFNDILRQVSKADPTIKPKEDREMIKTLENALSKRTGKIYTRVIQRWTEHYGSGRNRCTFKEAVTLCQTFKKDAEKADRLLASTEAENDSKAQKCQYCQSTGAHAPACRLAPACPKCGKKHAGRACPKGRRSRSRDRSKFSPNKKRHKHRSRSPRKTKKTTQTRVTSFDASSDRGQMPTYVVRLGGRKVLLYIDTGTELLLIDSEWLRENFPEVYKRRYRGTSWVVNGVGKGKQAVNLTCDYQVMIEFTQTSIVDGVTVTSGMTHEGLLVEGLGEPFLAGRSWQDAAEMTIHRSADPRKRRITSGTFNDSQTGETKAEYNSWKKRDTAAAVTEMMRTTTVYRTLLEHQPKDELEGEKIATVDALFRQDSSTAGRR